MDSLAAAVQRCTAVGPDEQNFTGADGSCGSTVQVEGPATWNGSSSQQNPKRARPGDGEFGRTQLPDSALDKDADVGASSSQRPMETSNDSATLMTAELLMSEATARVATMFDVSAKAVAASGRPGSMEKPSKELVLICWKVIRALCEKQGKALSAVFGNFDQLVGQGWLIGDMVLGRLIDKGDAFAIGRKAGKLGPTLEAAFAAPRKRVLGLKLVDAEQHSRELAMAATAEKALRVEPVDLPPLNTVLAMPPPAPPPSSPPQSPTERHTKALQVLRRAIRQETSAKEKMKAWEDQMDQMGPEADWAKLSNVEEQFRACNGGELSTAVRHKLDRLEQALQRQDDAILRVDANWKKAHAAWQDAWQVRSYAQLESNETERVLRAAQAAEEVERRAEMEAELLAEMDRHDELLAWLAKRKQEEEAYIERLDIEKAGMRWADGSLVYRADGSLTRPLLPREEDSDEQPDMDLSGGGGD